MLNKNPSLTRLTPPLADLEYTFAVMHGVQRHLAPGTYARLRAVGVFTSAIQEDLWVHVVGYDEHDYYTGIVTSPARDFDQLTLDEYATFKLDQVAEMRGAAVIA